MPDGTEQSHPVASTLDKDDWDTHWDAYAGAAAVNPAQEFRRRLILRLLVNVSPTSRVLDIGSGTGDLAVVLRKSYPSAQLLGLELSRSGIELSRRSVADATFLQRDLLVDEPAPVEYRCWATHAVCSEVLEHVDDPRRLLVNSADYLSPGCLLVVTVPGGPMTSFDRHIGHRRHFTPDELRTVLGDAGFDVVLATGAGYPIFNLYRLLMRAIGDRLIAVAGTDTPSLPAQAAGRVFSVLLEVNTRLSRRGWQTVAVARAPVGLTRS